MKNIRFLLMVLVASCSYDQPDTHLQKNAKGNTAPVERRQIQVPEITDRNIFEFVQVDVSVDIPWKSWRLVGTFSIDEQTIHALIIDASGDSLVVSQTTKLPTEHWRVDTINDIQITFIHTKGLRYSLQHKR